MSSGGLALNNGVVVRGVRLLRTFETRRFSWWKSALVSLVTASPESVEAQWTVITVSGVDGERAALRRFPKQREADDARQELVRVITSMTDDQLAAADWQLELDAI